MKTLLENEYLGFAGRLILGLMFVVASVEKMADPAAFATSIGYYRLVSADFALISATILPWIELLCGIGLMFGLFLRGNSLLALLMLVVFTAAVITAVLRGLDISCGCFTQDPDVGKVGWLKVGENMLMILTSVFVFFSTASRLTLEQYFQRRNAGVSSPQ